MDIALVQQFLTNGLPRAPFKQDVIWHDNRRPAVDFQNRFDVLQEVKLLVGRGRPKILPFIGERVFPAPPFSSTIVILLFLPKGGLVNTMSKR